MGSGRFSQRCSPGSRRWSRKSAIGSRSLSMALQAATKSRGVRRHARGQVMAQFAVSSVALLSVIVAIADVALWLHAQNVVVAAAQEGATVASREGGTALAGRLAASELLQAGLGPSTDAIQHVQVQVDADAATAE